MVVSSTHGHPVVCTAGCVYVSVFVCVALCPLSNYIIMITFVSPLYHNGHLCSHVRIAWITFVVLPSRHI